MKIKCDVCRVGTELSEERSCYKKYCENGVCQECYSLKKDYGYSVETNNKSIRVVLCCDCAEDDENKLKVDSVISEATGEL